MTTRDTAERRTGLGLLAALTLTLLAALAFGLSQARADGSTPSSRCAPTGMEQIWTDQADYPPGSTVQVGGSGFASACDLTLDVNRPDGVIDTVDASTGLGGSLSASYVLPPPPGVIGPYSIDARGLDGAVLASVEFTDGTIGLHGTATAQNGNPSSPASLVISKPSGTLPGDVLIAQVVVNGGSNTTIGAPAGWTLTGTKNDSSTDVGQAIYRKVATGSEPISYTWTITNSSNTPRAVGGMAAYTGVDTSSPVETVPAGSASTGTGTYSAPAVTTTVVNDRIVNFYGVDVKTSISTSTGTPTATQVFCVTTTASGCSLEETESGGPSGKAQDWTQATVGTTITRSATGSVAPWVANSIGLKPDNTNPTGSLDINSGAAVTNTTAVTLNLSATDAGGVVKYRVANGSDCSAATFVTVTQTTSYSANVAFTLASGDGSKTVCVQYQDAAGNNSSTFTDTITLDATAPTVSSIDRVTSSPTNASSVQWTVTFSESVTGVGSSDFTLANTGLTSPSITGVTGSGSSYTVTASTGTGNGTLGLNLNGSGTGITDAAGNPIAGGFTGQVYTIDKTAPVYASSAVNVLGTQVTLTYTETGSGLNTGITPATSAFTVTGCSGSCSVTNVSVASSTTVVLTTASRIFGGASVTVAYTQPVSNKLQDNAGNLAANLAASAVTNTAPASLSQSTVSGTSPITANGISTSTITVQLKNSGGTNLLASGGAVIVSTTAGTFPGSCTTNCPTIDNGNGTYTATLTSSTTAQNVTVSAKLDGSSITNTGSVVFQAGAVDHFKVEANGGGNIATQTAGSAFSVQVTAQDSFNNTVTSFTGAGNTVNITSNRTCSSGCATSGTFTNGVLTGHSLTLTQSGTLSTVTATRTSGGVQTGTSNTFTVDPGAADHLTFTSSTADLASGADRDLTAEVRDAAGNLVTGDDSTVVTFAKDSGAGTVTGLGGATASGGVATKTVTGDQAGSITITAAATGLTGDSTTFTITPAGLAHFKIDTIGQQQAGVGFSFHVTAQDSSNNTVTGFTGTVDVTSTLPIAGAPLTSANFVNGELTIPITLTTGAMSASITVTRTGGSEMGTSNSFRVVEADGAGTLTVSPTFAPYNSTGNTLAFTYTPAGGGMVNGAISIQVPADWSQASTLGTAPGFTKTSAGTVSVSPDGRTITVSIPSRAENNPLTITYGAKSSGGPGASAPPSSGPETWFGKSRGATGGTLQPLNASPSVNVLAQDGSGTISASPNQVVKSTTGNTITFTYTAATGGMQNGAITLSVPGGWSTPSTVPTADGYTTSSTGTITLSGATVNVNGVTLNGGQTLTVKYGDKGSGGFGATAPATAQVQTWTTKQRSSNVGTLTSLAAQPSVTVLASPPPPDHFDIDPIGTQQAGVGFSFHVVARDSSGNIQTSYSGPGTGVTVSSNRTIPGGSFTSADFVNGQLTIPITLTDGGTDSTVTVTKSSVTKTSNTFRVLQADGAGSMTLSPTFVRNGSAGNTLTFVYNPVAGGILNGTVSIDVPTGWSDPSTVSSAAGYVTVSGGSVTIDGRTIVAAIVDRGVGNALTIKYGVKTGGGPGATAPTTGGSVPWTAKSKGAAGGTAQPLASSPSVNVLAVDGSGSISPSPNSVPRSTANTITFTYTADTGGMQNGTITLAVPAGWSAPSTTPTAAGYTTASAGSVATASRTITVSGITLNGGDTMTIKYGDTSGGGLGGIAPPTAGAQTWTTKQRSNSGGTLTPVAPQPSINVT